MAEDGKDVDGVEAHAVVEGAADAALKRKRAEGDSGLETEASSEKKKAAAASAEDGDEDAPDDGGSDGLAVGGDAAPPGAAESAVGQGEKEEAAGADTANGPAEAAAEPLAAKAGQDKPEATSAPVFTSVFSAYSNAASPFASVVASDASPFASVSASDASPFASATASGASPFASFTGSSSAFGQAAGDAKGAFGDTGSGEKESGGASEPQQQETVFGDAGDSADEKDAAEEVVFTGEENEECLFKIRAKLYRLCDVEPEADAKEGAAQPRREYKEMGAGLVRVNVPRSTPGVAAPGGDGTMGATGEAGPGTSPAPKPRMVMRREGVLKLLLNATIWATMPIQKASEKVLRFTCKSNVEDMSSDGPDTFLLRLPRANQCQELLEAIEKAREMSKEGSSS